MNLNDPIQPLLTKEEHLKLLEKSRRLEATRDEIAKRLKCGPEEIGDKINKVLKHISELEQEIKKFAKINIEQGG